MAKTPARGGPANWLTGYHEFWWKGIGRGYPVALTYWEGAVGVRGGRQTGPPTRVGEPVGAARNCLLAKDSLQRAQI